jgi:hypothetical protein
MNKIPAASSKLAARSGRKELPDGREGRIIPSARAAKTWIIINALPWYNRCELLIISKIISHNLFSVKGLSGKAESVTGPI